MVLDYQENLQHVSENNQKYLESKRKYNSTLSTFQISKELHKKIKDHCKNNGLKVKDFLEHIISKNLS
jgi:hypothetical protein